MPRTKDLEESKVATVLDLSVLVAIVESDIFDLSFVESFLTRPFECVGPSLVTKPVANEVGITSVDQDWKLLENTWHKTVEGLHPVALEEEIAVDIEVAAVVAADLDSEFLLNIFLVQELADPAKCRVAEIARVLTFTTDIVDILDVWLVQVQ